MRGLQVARTLGARIVDQMDNTKNDVVVFIKFADGNDVRRAKEQGNLVVWDVLDFFCYQERTINFGKDIDVLIVPNEQCGEIYKSIIPNARLVVIHHHWDTRVKGEAPQDQPRVGYMGAAFNIAEHMKPQGKFKLDFEMVTELEKMVEAAPRFNLHVCVSKRQGISRIAKPATKIALAAAVGACAVTHKDPSSQELLGDDYPFYIGDSLARSIADAKAAFGTEKWEKARKIMREVKEKTSLPYLKYKYMELQSQVYA